MATWAMLYWRLFGGILICLRTPSTFSELLRRSTGYIVSSLVLSARFLRYSSTDPTSRTPSSARASFSRSSHSFSGTVANSSFYLAKALLMALVQSAFSNSSRYSRLTSWADLKCAMFWKMTPWSWIQCLFTWYASMKSSRFVPKLTTVDSVRYSSGKGSEWS